MFLPHPRFAPDDEVRPKSPPLIAGKSTPDEKARAIYAWVRSQVRCINGVFGVGRFLSHEAGDILSNQWNAS